MLLVHINTDQHPPHFAETIADRCNERLCMNPNPASEHMELLAMLLDRCPTTVEIIPGDATSWSPDSTDRGPYHPFLFIDGNLGVPQKVLYALYPYAVNVFNDFRKACLSSRETPQASSRSKPTDLLESSSVILLANPSHQTTLNARKRLVREGTIDPEKELRFTSSLLSCQHCTKHGELWYHRRWMFAFSQQLSSGEHSRSSFHIPLASLGKELALIARACELYPRNYFAWMHRFICFRSVVHCHPIGALSNQLSDILNNEIDDIKRWMECHVSDYSAVHYLISLSQLFPQLQGLNDGLYHHSTSLVRAYPSHETLWIYAYAACLMPGTHGEDPGEFLEGFVRPLAQLRSTDVLTDDDSAQASQHGQRFLARRELGLGGELGTGC
ncbi:protein prenylyltransferase [Pisolithus orientalis]|uniref:protein prenylyltransferase n=1 Tax=Pisolithus orientalis TaxID=936130 RepID=UPI0022255155|nr:protein prenylyltransferase [Pisolithus orientalis]KAI6007694.1 protein prenylyltransferase [Pisolithus orientalis]